jgi:hypothetical protein
VRKTVIYLVLCLFSTVLLAGCAAMAVSPTTGFLYTEIKAPITATSNSGPAEKVGKAVCTSILGLVSTGDASIQAAMLDGKITKIHHVDYHSTNILGIYAVFEVIVYGE